MALTLEISDTGALELDEFISIVSAELDPGDTASIIECGKYLHALSMNRRLFDDIIRDVIEAQDSTRGFQQSYNGYREMTFLLGKCPQSKFFVRANVWKPPISVAGDTSLQSDIYSYSLAHDHNFDFVTVGYYGPGYRTSIFEYDNGKVDGYVGEHVDIEHLEDTGLPTGKVMMYRKSVDIHTQYPPEDTSVSINLMVQPHRSEYREQYSFDIESSQIAGFVEGPVNYQVSLLSLAAALGDEDLVGPLIKVAENALSGRTRAAAITALLEMSPDFYEMLLSKCGADRHPLVVSSLMSRLSLAI